MSPTALDTSLCLLVAVWRKNAHLNGQPVHGPGYVSVISNCHLHRLESLFTRIVTCCVVASAERCAQVNSGSLPLSHARACGQPLTFFYK